MKSTYYLLIFLWVSLWGCSPSENSESTPIYPLTTTTVNLSTDKAVYSPNESVQFSLDALPQGNCFVHYYHLGQLLSTAPLTTQKWTWTPPVDNYKGYMAVVVERRDTKEKVLGSIAIDVSSDWKKYPRYGFLSMYEAMTDEAIDGVLCFLKRCHINGIQYQDWHYKHHQPLAGTAAQPLSQWQDIAQRIVQKSTLDRYIAQAHTLGMKSIFYNLCYGALKDASSDGVDESWYLFKDTHHRQKDKHDLPNDYFWSDIYLVDPASQAWQNYLIHQNNEVYAVYDFDGYQIDQLGNRGTLYDYTGNSVDLSTCFASFIRAMKQAQPDKSLIMNAVAGYGQQNIAQTDVDFFYNEVWGDTPKYTDLVNIIQQNRSYRQDLSTVFAAYMNYNLANQKGYFNTPGVLLTDAVIFAHGASHLELGEHMLGKEYFPNNNLKMKADLRKSIVQFYDFMVAYQNLLRPVGETAHVELGCRNGRASFEAWPPATGKVAYLDKQVGNKTVIQMINLSQASDFDWRDIDGHQPTPDRIEGASIRIKTTQKVNRVWVASPDDAEGMPQELSFSQSASGITITYPQFRYWGIIVLE
jgi:dextranase